MGMKGIFFSLMTLAVFMTISSLAFLNFSLNNYYNGFFVNSISASRVSFEKNSLEEALFKAGNILPSSEGQNLTFESVLNPEFNYSSNLEALSSFLNSKGLGHDFSNISQVFRFSILPSNVNCSVNSSAKEIVFSSVSQVQAFEVSVSSVDSASWTSTPGPVTLVIKGPGFEETVSVSEANVTVQTSPSSSFVIRYGHVFLMDYANSSGEKVSVKMTFPSDEIFFARIPFQANLSSRGYSV